MGDTSLPICPVLRNIAIALNEYWDQIDDDLPEAVFEIARRIRAPDAPTRCIREAMTLSVYVDCGREARNAAARLTLALMRVHQIGIQSPTTGEVIRICGHCGRVALQRETLH